MALKIFDNKFKLYHVEVVTYPVSNISFHHHANVPFSIHCYLKAITVILWRLAILSPSTFKQLQYILPHYQPTHI